MGTLQNIPELLLQPAPSTPRVSRGSLRSLGLTMVTLACASATVGPHSNSSPFVSTSSASTDSAPLVQFALPGSLARSLIFEWKAANLALQSPYDTVQLRAIPRTTTGAVVRDLAVQYMTPDSDITVSATGLVTAHAATVTEHQSHVIAQIIQGQDTLRDTAMVRITPTPLSEPLATLSIQPHAGGLTNARVNVQEEGPVIPVIMSFGQGQSRKETICTNETWHQCPLVVGFESSDRSIGYPESENGGATDRRVFQSVQVGHVTVIASTIAYGVRKRDSLRLSVGYRKRPVDWEVYMVDASRQPPLLNIRRKRDYNPPDLPPFGVGVIIRLSNSTGEPFDVTLGKESLLEKGVLAADATPKSDKRLAFKLDSADTYIFRYRGLNSGATLSDTVVVLPYP